MAGKVRKKELKQEAKLAAISSAPKARSAYALFLSSRYEEFRSQGTDRRMIISQVAQEWRVMSAESRGVWIAKSKDEKSKRQRQISEMTSQFASFQTDPEPSNKEASPNMIGKFQVVEREDVHASLGRGSFAETFLVKHRRCGYMAVGKVWSENRVEHSDSIEAFKKEIAVYKALESLGCNKSSHPFCEVLEHSEHHAPTRFMVLQRAEIAMNHWILKKGPMFEKVADVAFQIAKALVYLHVVAEFVHGDLKPSNLLFEEDAFRVKLINFHFTQPYDASGSKVWNDTVYTMPYRPPELWKQLHADLKVQGEFGTIQPASDVWALGCTCFELCTGDILFPAFPDISKYCTKWDCGKASSMKTFPAALARQNRSTPLIQFMLEILHPNCMKRMSAMEIETSKSLMMLQKEMTSNLVVMC